MNAGNYIINSTLNTTKPVILPMLELGKIEGRAKNMNPYQSPRKAETGLSSDTVPQELREFTPAEIRSSVVEAERGYRTCPVVVHVMKISDFQPWFD
jgi:hypothetical protein